MSVSRILQEFPTLTEYAHAQGLDEAVLQAVLIDKGIITSIVGVRDPARPPATATPTPTPPTTGATESDMDDVIAALGLVRPGDLITSTQLNNITRAIVGLHRRMLRVERLDRAPAPANPAPAPTPSPPPPPPPPVTRAPEGRRPAVTSAAYQNAEGGRGAVSIRGTNLEEIDRIEINGVEVDPELLTVRDNSIDFVYPAGDEDLRGATITVFGKTGQDDRALVPATGKRLSSLKQLIRNQER